MNNIEYICSFSNRGLTETEIRNYIYNNLPGISKEDMWSIRNEFVYNNISLEVAVYRYFRDKMIQKWGKSKNKHYYRVKMLNGGYKIVYMCKEQVEDFYHNKDITLIG